jgi:hypothetical protein
MSLLALLNCNIILEKYGSDGCNIGHHGVVVPNISKQVRNYIDFLVSPFGASYAFKYAISLFASSMFSKSDGLKVCILSYLQ